jgi:hypothetical protein
MSQNQKEANIDGVVEGLIGDGEERTAETVERLRPARGVGQKASGSSG